MEFLSLIERVGGIALLKIDVLSLARSSQLSREKSGAREEGKSPTLRRGGAEGRGLVD
jgi:hypothetical protein